MTPESYRTALTTLGLSQLAAGRWLGVSPKTAQRYAVDGPSPGAAKAVKLALIVKQAMADLSNDNSLVAVGNAEFALRLAMEEIERERK